MITSISTRAIIWDYIKIIILISIVCKPIIHCLIHLILQTRVHKTVVNLRTRRHQWTLFNDIKASSIKEKLPEVQIQAISCKLTRWKICPRKSMNNAPHVSNPMLTNNHNSIPKRRNQLVISLHQVTPTLTLKTSHTEVCYLSRASHVSTTWIWAVLNPFQSSFTCISNS